MKTQVSDALIAAWADQDREVRQAALQSLLHLGDSRAVDECIRNLQTPVPDEKLDEAIWSCQELSRLREPLAAVALGMLLDHPNLTLANAALEALTCIPASPESLPRIAACLNSLREVREGKAVCAALRQSGCQEAVPFLIKALSYDMPYFVRNSAAAELEKLGWVPATADDAAELAAAKAAQQHLVWMPPPDNS